MENFVKINPKETNYLVVGQQATITLKVHGSVGIKSKAKSTDESIISLVTSTFAYSNSAVPRLPGGDGGHRTYVFKANKQGSTTITTQRIFRGKLEHEQTIEMIVTA